ncbi:MAG TPA: ATP-grasp domain-containing protein [Gemmataceae bacterium]|nr:ATP-grasp domain-containing protein [Gemmataceae bacterium]
MRRPTVWLNKGLSSTFDVVELLRATGDEFRVVCSHTDPDVPAARACHVFETEPKRLGEAAYLDYCLDFANRHAVDVFIPGKMLGAIVRERGRFADLGVRLIAAGEADTLKLVDDKAALYASLPAGLVPVPDFEVVRDLAGFDAAYAWLRERHPVICFKPAVSIFGLGFRRVTESEGLLDRLLGGESYTVSLKDARRAFAERPTFKPLIVMEFLAGAERSVDCLARRGELVRCVVRKKTDATDGPQLLEANPHVESMTRRLTGHLRLDGLFNVQFRDRGDEPHLLEINPRMSGGLFYACHSGVNFPVWAVRLALGTASPGDVPQPETGFCVTKVNRAVRR